MTRRSEELRGLAELKPCPFCGSREIGHAQRNGGAWHVCMTCGARGPDTVTGSLEEAQTWDDMQRAWNMRAGDA
jgi:Lar family restriction alleviation protein